MGPVGTTGDRFDANRVGLDHLSLLVESVAELHADEAGGEAEDETESGAHQSGVGVVVRYLRYWRSVMMPEVSCYIIP